MNIPLMDHSVMFQVIQQSDGSSNGRTGKEHGKEHIDPRSKDLTGLLVGRVHDLWQMLLGIPLGKRLLAEEDELTRTRDQAARLSVKKSPAPEWQAEHTPETARYLRYENLR
jgi:hypothetical protein